MASCAIRMRWMALPSPWNSSTPIRGADTLVWPMLIFSTIAVSSPIGLSSVRGNLSAKTDAIKIPKTTVTDTPQNPSFENPAERRL